MIVNPPRSEVDFSSRLRSISVQATDKNEDPDDLPPLIPSQVKRRLAGLVLILVVTVLVRGGLGFFTYYHESTNGHSATAEMYRNLAHDLEVDAMTCRTIVKTGKPDTIQSVGLVNDPVFAKSLAIQFDKQAAAFRKQAHMHESINQGYSIR
jgi:hypothetical protein